MWGMFFYTVVKCWSNRISVYVPVTKKQICLCKFTWFGAIDYKWVHPYCKSQYHLFTMCHILDNTNVSDMILLSMLELGNDVGDMLTGIVAIAVTK